MPHAVVDGFVLFDQLEMSWWQ